MRAVLKTKSIVTLEHTIAAIAERSRGVCWLANSEGFTLILTPRGYLLTAARPGMPQTAMLPERVLVPRDDGRAMGYGLRAPADAVRTRTGGADDPRRLTAEGEPKPPKTRR